MEKLEYSARIRNLDLILSELNIRDVGKIGISCSDKDIGFNFV